MEGIRVINTLVHGTLDYIVGIALILAPTIFGFSDVGGSAVLVPRVLGVLLIVYSLLTRYELGIIRLIPAGYHLGIDFLAGLFLALSPYIYGFTDQSTNVWYPHLIVGIVIMLLAIISETQPHDSMDYGTMGGRREQHM